MTAPDPLAVARKVHEALELLNGRKLAIGGVAIVAAALTEYRNEGIEEAAEIAEAARARRATMSRTRIEIAQAIRSLKRTP